MISSVPETAKTGMRTVAVASTLGTKFHGIHIGTTAFSNQRYDADVAAGRVDEKAEQVAASLLSRDGKRVAKPLGGSFKATDLSGMIAAAKSVGADTLVIVQPSGYSNQPEFAGGYGYAQRTFLGYSRQCIYSLFTLDVYDVASGKRTAVEWGFSPWEGVPCYGADKKIPWREDFASFTAEEQAGLRAEIVQSIEINVATGVQRLGL